VNEKRALNVFGRVKAVITESHVVYTSGKHGTAYVDKDAVYPHTTETSRLCRGIAQCFVGSYVEVVVAPEKGGIILSQWVAFHLSRILDQEVLAFYAEKEVIPIPDPDSRGRKCFAETGNFVIKRGGAKTQISGKIVLVVEDVLNTGGSARKVVEAVRTAGGIVVGVGVLCNRGGVTRGDLGNVPKLVALVNVKMDAWSEEECLETGPCSKGVPINTDVGKGREFLAKKKEV